MHNQSQPIPLPLDEKRVPADPISLFGDWYRAASKLELREPGAVALASATPDGRPSVRMVLLKDFSSDGFVFYTNYHSRKGQELDNNPQAALVLYWDAVERQVRIEGRINRLGPTESDVYFKSRPLASRISATVSEQSHPIENREALIERVKKLEMVLKGTAPSRPSYWGGYRLNPEMIEFWQGRQDRLHDRIVYRRKDDRWNIVRLQP